VDYCIHNVEVGKDLEGSVSDVRVRINAVAFRFRRRFPLFLC
jgi:hypothetical protein